MLTLYGLMKFWKGLGGAVVAAIVNPLRKVTVCLENRTLNINLENRANSVILEDRSLIFDLENRISGVTLENRSLKVRL